MEDVKHPVFIVVDDDEDDRMIVRGSLTFALAHAPPEIIELENGAELIDYLQTRWNPSSTNPPFVVMDVNMPMMKGDEALQLMQAHAAWKQIPVLIMSTSTDPRLAQQVVQAGAKAFLLKSSSYASFLAQLTGSLTSLYANQLSQ